MARDERTQHGSVEVEYQGKTHHGTYTVYKDGDVTVHYVRPDGKSDTRTSHGHRAEYLTAQGLLVEMIPLEPSSTDKKQAPVIAQ